MEESKRQEYLKKYYTEKGIASLENRLKNLIEVYTDNVNYPFKARMFGFIELKIHSKAHHEGMIDNLCQMLGRDTIKLEVKRKW